MSFKGNHQLTAKQKIKFPGIYFLILFFYLLSVFSGAVTCQAQVDRDPDIEQLRFIKKLYAHKNYHRSISEILRVKFQFPQTSERRKLDLYLLKNYYSLKEYQSIDTLASEILLEKRINSDKQIDKQSSLIIITSLIQQGEEKRAQRVWETYYKNDNEDIFPSSDKLLGLINPDRASFYSGILPGSGFLFSEEYGKAIVSLALNLIFISGSYQAFAHQNYGISGLLMFFEISWYFGGKKASAESARRFNRNLIKHSQQNWVEIQLKENDLSDLIPKTNE